MDLENTQYLLDIKEQKMKVIKKIDKEHNIDSANVCVEIGEYPSKYVNKPKYIHRYNYTPKFIKGKIECDDDELYMGFELEVDDGGVNYNTAKTITDMLGDDVAYIVEDGSLDEGFEIVSHPQTLAKHKSNNYEEVLKFLKIQGYKDAVSCGLHIHINRDFFGNATQSDFAVIKMINLINKFWVFNEEIARRGSVHYSQKINIKAEDSIFAPYIKAKDIGKYSCVNLEHKETIELRLFRGTLNYTYLMSTLEYVRNLAYLCKSLSIEDLDTIEFKDIINIKPLDYLDRYCEVRKIQY